MGNLSTVIAPGGFGGSGSIPIEMRKYLKGAATLGWNGGVAAHENNSNIPTSGTIFLSNFDSPANRDFLSGNWDDAVSFYTDGFFYTETLFGYATNAAVIAAGFIAGGMGSTATRTVIGKSTYNSAETATADGVWDYVTTWASGTVLSLVGDQRRSGWGGTGASGSGGSAGDAPTYITINGKTFNFDNAVTPSGTYDGTQNRTIWVWVYDGISLAGLDGNGTFTWSLSIFA